MLLNLFLGLAVCLANLSTVLANFPIHNNDFTNPDRHWYVASVAAPNWHFDKNEKCYPTAALYEDGTQHRPGISNCAPKSTTNQAHPFPTYFRVRRCDYAAHTEYHVMYNVYFPYSTNLALPHNHDWEWANVKWVKWSQDPNYWVRKSIVLEHHGDKTEYDWPVYANTNSPDNRNRRKDAENPIIHFGFDGHPLQATQGSPTWEGKWFWAADWLVNSWQFPGLPWGSADSSPDTFGAGGTHDLCWKAG